MKRSIARSLFGVLTTLAELDLQPLRKPTPLQEQGFIKKIRC